MEEGFRLWANPSSPHAEGRKARALLEDARERIKAALGWDGELIFTSGASEALAIGLGRAKLKRRIVSAVEHDAVFRAAPGAEVMPLNESMIGVDLDWLAHSLVANGPAIVAIQAVNSETGLCLLQSHGFDSPAQLREQVNEHGGLLLSDCSQAAGKLPLPDTDMSVISAHKFGGPIGIGALLVRDFAQLEPIGGHERGYRMGTENLPGALGMAAALECGRPTADPSRQSVAFGKLLNAEGVWAETGYDCGYIFALSHPKLTAQAQLIQFDAQGFAVSAGSACSSGTLKTSKVLSRLGLGDDAASRTIRVSTGWTTTPAELDSFAEAWAALAS
jgi:cysteine desulfurase